MKTNRMETPEVVSALRVDVGLNCGLLIGGLRFDGDGSTQKRYAA